MATNPLPVPNGPSNTFSVIHSNFSGNIADNLNSNVCITNNQQVTETDESYEDAPILFNTLTINSLASSQPYLQRIQNFNMIKFRTMFLNTELVETSKLQKPELKITKLGKILRRYSLDEIPQIFNVFAGSMAIVGPRPALPNQLNLIKNRKKFGIEKIKPGITGYAQINGRDLISDEKKLYLEAEYINRKSFYVDCVIILKTFKVVFNKIGISH